jgi:hypothetical protein
MTIPMPLSTPNITATQHHHHHPISSDEFCLISKAHETTHLAALISAGPLAAVASDESEVV